MSGLLFLLLVLVLDLQYSGAKEQEMTVEVGPGKEECFFESVKQGFTLGVEYQVISSS